MHNNKNDGIPVCDDDVITIDSSDLLWNLESDMKLLGNYTLPSDVTEDVVWRQTINLDNTHINNILKEKRVRGIIKYGKNQQKRCYE